MCLLAKFVANAIAASGKTPLDVQIGAGNPAGATFQTPFVIDADALSLLKPIDIGRTEIKTGLFLALFHALLTVDYPEMAFLIYPKAV
jgi:hypothetical protein